MAHQVERHLKHCRRDVLQIYLGTVMGVLIDEQNPRQPAITHDAVAYLRGSSTSVGQQPRESRGRSDGEKGGMGLPMAVSAARRSLRKVPVSGTSI